MTPQDRATLDRISRRARRALAGLPLRRAHVIPFPMEETTMPRVTDEFLADKAERTAAHRRLDAARTALNVARASGDPERVAAAETERDEAQAALRTLLSTPGPTVAQS